MPSQLFVKVGPRSTQGPKSNPDDATPRKRVQNHVCWFAGNRRGGKTCALSIRFEFVSSHDDPEGSMGNGEKTAVLKMISDLSWSGASLGGIEGF